MKIGRLAADTAMREQRRDILRGIDAVNLSIFVPSPGMRRAAAQDGTEKHKPWRNSVLEASRPNVMLPCGHRPDPISKDVRGRARARQ
jgi:hypothetical protein